MDMLLLKARAGAPPGQVIMEALRLHGQYFFSDLFDIPEIVDFVKVGGVESRLLSLFCSGTYSDFRANPELYGTHLETALLEKLKLLTLCTLAETNRKLPYAQVRATLDLDSEGEVEGLVIKAIYAGLVEGQLDQREKCIHTMGSAGRDVLQSDLPSLSAGLSALQKSVKDAMKGAERELGDISRALKAEAAHKVAFEDKCRAVIKKKEDVVGLRTDSTDMEDPSFVRKKGRNE